MRLGVIRGWIELKHCLKDISELWSIISITGLLLAILFFQRHMEFDGMPLISLTQPSLIAFSIIFGGFFTVAARVAAERDDGTILRAKATPYGIVGYLVSRITHSYLYTIVLSLLLLYSALLLFNGIESVSVISLCFFLAFAFFSFGSLIFWGILIGTKIQLTSANFGLFFITTLGVTAVSGIAYPGASLPDWVQYSARLLPFYWIGYGMRFIFLSEFAFKKVDSPEHLISMIIVLASWTIAGFAILSRFIKPMVAKQVGSLIAKKKQESLARGY
jgi:ABC-2 type transport system permease protein